MAVNSPNSPRQKMINLMYLVFIAMLALNVSAEVLDGFGLVDDSLRDSSGTMTDRNDLIMNELAQYREHLKINKIKYFRSLMSLNSYKGFKEINRLNPKQASQLIIST